MLLTVHDNIRMKNVIKRFKSVKLLSFKSVKCTRTLSSVEILTYYLLLIEMIH